LTFVELSDFSPRGDFDLCHVNGVFHHIAPDQRVAALHLIRDALRPRGQFAFMENNPWNPGTRLVMSRIAFDADAIPVSVLEAKRLLQASGFDHLSAPRFLFWFPRWLAVLRVLEPHLVHLPLGGQYYFLATKLQERG
jgi:SAM-dependent methyltransferase